MYILFFFIFQFGLSLARITWWAGMLVIISESPLNRAGNVLEDATDNLLRHMGNNQWSFAKESLWL